MARINRQLLEALEEHYGAEGKPECVSNEQKEQGVDKDSGESACVETKMSVSSTEAEEKASTPEEEKDCEEDPDYWEESDETEWVLREE